MSTDRLCSMRSWLCDCFIQYDNPAEYYSYRCDSLEIFDERVRCCSNFHKIWLDDNSDRIFISLDVVSRLRIFSCLT